MILFFLQKFIKNNSETFLLKDYIFFLSLYFLMLPSSIEETDAELKYNILFIFFLFNKLNIRKILKKFN